MTDQKQTIDQLSRCVKTISAFKGLGFSSFSAFSRVVCDYHKKYNTEQNLFVLWKHWVMREPSYAVMIDLENVLQKIKSE